MVMMNDEKDFAGKDGFVWWTGIVEDKQDPLKLGRCKVRCVGWHSDDKMKLSTDNLPWAMAAYPINQTHPYAPREGDMVFGFFIDGEHAQQPVMVGIYPTIPLKAPDRSKAFEDDREDSELKNSPRFPASKIYKEDGSGIIVKEKDKASLYPDKLDEPTTPRMARNEKINETFIQERKDNAVKGIPVVNITWDEPVTEYDTKYPYNNVIETESGHYLEFDDTFGKERIHLAHRTGCFMEWYPDGSKVEKIVMSNYTITMKDDHVYIMGKCYLTVQGDAELYVMKNAYVKVDGNFDMNVGGTCDIKSGATMTLVAPKIDLNP